MRLKVGYLKKRNPLMILILLFFLVFTKRIEAAPIYTPGETLNPTCLPSNSDCTVIPPMVASIGTTLSNQTISGSENTIFNIGNSSLINSGLTITAGNGLIGGGYISLGGTTTVALNLGASNVWTGLQTFNSVTINDGFNITVTSNQLNLGASGSKTIINANTQTTDKIVTIPALTANDAFVFNNNSVALTNKTIAAGSNTITGLTTNNLSAGASIANTQLANPNISIITAVGSGLQGGGVVGLGGSLSLSFVSVATPGIYGSATQIPVFQIDQYGSVINVTPTTISGLTSSNLSATAGITNAQLVNSSINVDVVAGTGIGISGSPVALGGTVKIVGLDATAVVKGMASFDATNFSVVNGAVDTIQHINTLATPTFSALFLNNNLSVLGTTNQLSLGSTNTTTISAIAPSTSRIATIPGLTINDTFAFVGQTQTFINKTIDAGSNTISSLTNSNLSGSAGITDANLATITTTDKVSGSAIQLNTNGGIGNSGGLSLVRTCADGQLLKWTAAGGWECDTDISGGTPSVYLDGGLLSDGGGLSLIRTCSNGQLLKWNTTTGWTCDADIAGGGSLLVKESDGSPSLSPVVELQFGSTGVSTDEFIVSDLGSSMARIRIGNKVVMIDTAQTLTNKTISAVGNTITGLTNSSLSGSAGITDANLATITTTDKVSGSAIQLSSTGGLTNNSGLSLITTCSNSQVLAWNSSTSSWGCGARISILSNITAAIAANTINSSDFAQIWNWSLTTDAKTAFTFGENTAAINGTGSQYILGVSTKAGSTAAPLKVVAQNNTIIDTTALGGVTIGSQATNQPIYISSGTGEINIGTDLNAKTITIGTITGNTAINMSTGTGGFSLNGMGSSNYSVGTSTTTGIFNIGGVTQTGTANLFTGSGGMAINLGTGNAANTITIGNTTATTAIHLHTGTGDIETETANGNGMQFLTTTASDDAIRIAAGLNDGLNPFEGTITSADLTATRTWTLPDASGQIPLSTLNNGLFFTTTNNTNLTLPTSGTVTALGNSSTGSGSVLVLSTSPTFTTSILTPSIIGSAIADGTIIISGNNALSGNNINGVNMKFNVGDSGATTAMTILNNGNIGIGTTSPKGPLEVVMTDDYFQMTRYGDNAYAAGLAGQKARGTQSAPTALLLDDWITGLGGRGYDGVTFPSGVISASGIFIVAAAENFTPTNKGTYLSFIVTPIGSTTRGEKARLEADGTFRIYNTSNQLSLGSTAALTTISATAPTANRIATIPGLTINDTFVFVGQTQTLTSKTLSSPVFTGLTVGSGTTGVFIDGSGNLSKRAFGALAFAESAVGGGTNGLSMIGSTTVGLGGTLVQNTNIGTSSFGISFLGLGNSQALFIGTSGFVGIGTTNPQAKMNIIGNLQIGSRVGSSTPSYLVLDTGTSEPTGSNGSMYYNSSMNKFRCYENGAWRNCTGSNTTGVGVTFGTVTLQTGSTLLGTITITPSTASGDIYIYADLFTNSLSNTDQTITAEIRSGTTCAGTLLAEGVATLTGGNGTNGPSVLAATLVQNPGATAQNYAICGKTTTAGGSNTRGIVQALVIDSGADLAEIYSTNDASLEMGDVVSIDSDLKTGMKKSQTSYDRSVLGVVSAKPGLLIGDVDNEGVKALPVALSGRVLVKVNIEGGIIKVGDPLTTSSTPGTAMKATKTGSIIGTAMSDFNGEGTGQILVFIKNGSGNGTKIADLLPGVDENAKDFANQILTQLMWQKNNLALTDLSEIITDRLVAGVEIITPKIVTDKTQTKNLCVGEENNETCITKSQLDQILLKMNMETTITPTGTPMPTPTGVGVTLDITAL